MNFKPLLLLSPESAGGVCPVQYQGEMSGYPFYFRARHGTWKITVAREGKDPVALNMGIGDSKEILHQEEGEDDTEGFMELADVAEILLRVAWVTFNYDRTTL